MESGRRAVAEAEGEMVEATSFGVVYEMTTSRPVSI